MPRPAKPTDHLDKVKHLMGTMPDKDIAAMTGSTAAIVGNYRRKYAISAYEGYKFGKDQSPPGKKATGKRGGGKDNKAADAPASDAPRTRKRKSKLDGLHAEIGKIPDSVIAERAGVSVQNVRLYRRKHGIALDPSADQRRSASSDGAEAKSAATTDAAGAGRASKLDPFRDQIGEVPDGEIAALADVSEDAVREYRRRHGIGATRSSSSTAGSSTAGGKRGRKARSGDRGASGSGVQGYAVAIEAGGESREHILLANSITAAAERAAAALSSGELSGEIVCVRLLGPSLG